MRQNRVFTGLLSPARVVIPIHFFEMLRDVPQNATYGFVAPEAALPRWTASSTMKNARH